jgi:hypothetical protein
MSWWRVDQMSRCGYWREFGRCGVFAFGAGKEFSNPRAGAEAVSEHEHRRDDNRSLVVVRSGRWISFGRMSDQAAAGRCRAQRGTDHEQVWRWAGQVRIGAAGGGWTSPEPNGNGVSHRQDAFATYLGTISKLGPWRHKWDACTGKPGSAAQAGRLCHLLR